jgi:hypothetical protein
MIPRVLVSIAERGDDRVTLFFKYMGAIDRAP